jgi:hypothetical protein
MSSLNHSYETLNMSETHENNNNAAAAAAAAAIQRKPHRPAPPVPINEQFESSKAKLFPRGGSCGVETIVEQEEHQQQEQQHRQRRTSANRRAYRHRKIHSLKKQIQIKEKMLEVS